MLADLFEVREDLVKKTEEARIKDMEISQLKTELEEARQAIKTPSQSQTSTQTSQYCPEDISDKSLAGICD